VIFQTHKLVKKHHSWQKQGGEEMLPHFHPKPHLKKFKNKKNYTMFQYKSILKIIYLSSFNIFTHPLTFIFMTNHGKYQFGSSPIKYGWWSINKTPQSNPCY
jgi:hypothetical protein